VKRKAEERMPEPADWLLGMAELRLLAARWQVATVHLEKPAPGSSEPTYIVLDYRNPRRIKALAAQSKGRLRIVDESSAYLPFSPRRPNPRPSTSASRTSSAPDPVPTTSPGAFFRRHEEGATLEGRKEDPVPDPTSKSRPSPPEGKLSGRPQDLPHGVLTPPQAVLDALGPRKGQVPAGGLHPRV
jgi:hypothetical protein